MPKIVWVTPVQVDAAKLLIELAERSGKPVAPAIRVIANARHPAEEAASGPKIVWVTPVQVDAAKLLIELAAKSGKSVSPAVITIANAKRDTERAAS